MGSILIWQCLLKYQQACVFFPASDIDLWDLISIEKSPNTLGINWWVSIIVNVFILLHLFHPIYFILFFLCQTWFITFWNLSNNNEPTVHFSFPSQLTWLTLWVIIITESCVWPPWHKTCQANCSKRKEQQLYGVSWHKNGVFMKECPQICWCLIIKDMIWR